jgi:valyl-tRNA synthetase
MSVMPKRYDAASVEIKWQRYWDEHQVNRFRSGVPGPVYSIDTPPPTVSGDLHMGHCYSYSQVDFYARFWRMNGKNVFYPMGWDDNGLPTERLVESGLGITPESAGAEAFIQAIVQTSHRLEEKYERLWRRLGLSVDWTHCYSTVGAPARRIAQHSFIDLFRKEYVYRSSSPTIWCSSCQTAIARAETADMERATEFVTLAFNLENGQTVAIATTRPELLPACVAIFVNPEDARFRHLAGRTAKIPLFGTEVPILSDSRADPAKGTGVVMCCTFGDTTDIKWWREYSLPLISIIGDDGRLNDRAGLLAGLDVTSARQKVIELLDSRGLIVARRAASQTVSVHERCDTPVEYMDTKQWFIRIVDRKERLLEAGKKIKWHPPHMFTRYEDWVHGLEWDWCISRQRYYGVPFPLWYCSRCGRIVLANASELPVDPRIQAPSQPCPCGSRDFTPETSLMDTWATSSLSPQISSRWLEEPEFYREVFPMSLRPQAHDIIRTWTFYTVVKSLYHFDTVPWSDIAISGHGLSPEGHKVSKSRGGNVMDPAAVMDNYSADAVRYWAASTSLGEDSLINEDKIALGQRFVTKLWNVAGFSYPFIKDYVPSVRVPALLPVDRWVLSGLQSVISEVSESFRSYDHAVAKGKVETYFWEIIADNYLEMAKSRLYDSKADTPVKVSAKYTQRLSLETVLKLLAPIMPYVTEEIFQVLFGKDGGVISVHLAAWPEPQPGLVDPDAEIVGRAMVEIATNVRRYKSEHRLSMAAPLDRLEIVSSHHELVGALQLSITDIRSMTRAVNVVVTEIPPNSTSDERLASSVFVQIG